MQICIEGFHQVKREMEEIQKNIISLPAAYFHCHQLSREFLLIYKQYLKPFTKLVNRALSV